MGSPIRIRRLAEGMVITAEVGRSVDFLKNPNCWKSNRRIALNNNKQPKINLYKLGSIGILLPKKDAGTDPTTNHKKVFFGKLITR